MSHKSVKLANADSTSQLGSGQPLINDCKDFLSVFPEELWIVILDKIKDPETLENLSIASPLFRKLLLSRRVEFLFPKVFPFLAAKLEIPSGPHAPLVPFQTVNPFSRVVGIFIQDYKLRRVCSRWDTTVKNFRESHVAFSCILKDSKLQHHKPLDSKMFGIKAIYYMVQEGLVDVTVDWQALRLW